MNVYRNPTALAVGVSGSKQTGEDIKICSWDLDNISIRVYEKGIIRIKQKTGMKKLVQIPYK